MGWVQEWRCDGASGGVDNDRDSALASQPCIPARPQKSFRERDLNAWALGYRSHDSSPRCRAQPGFQVVNNVTMPRPRN